MLRGPPQAASKVLFTPVRSAADPVRRYRGIGGKPSGKLSYLIFEGHARCDPFSTLRLVPDDSSLWRLRWPTTPSLAVASIVGLAATASGAAVAQVGSAASRPAKPLQDPRTKYTRGPFREQRQQ